MAYKFNPLSNSLDIVNSKASDLKTTSGLTVQEVLDNVGSPFLFIGDIALNSDFPLIADVNNGWTYNITADVIDNDPTKTNTLQSFKKGDTISWNGTNWTDITGIEVFIENETEIKAINNKDINLQTSGLKDENVTTAVKLGDALNTSLKTTNKTILGAVNENKEKTEGVIISNGNTNNITIGGRYGMIGTPTNGAIAGEFALDVTNDGTRVMQIATYLTGVVYTRYYTGSSWSSWAKYSDSAKANLSGATFTGAISATNLSGTNTGDETKATIESKLTGDISSHTHDGRYYTETETDILLSGKLNTSLKGAVNGLAELDAGGKVPIAQLPSYVDDVLEFANLASFPVTGETGKIYIAIDTNFSYRWGGSTYIEIADGKAIWGGISGDLSNQTDLQNALNAKVSTTGNETIAGTKTFTGSITASNLSGTNTGDETKTSIITKIGAASSSNNGYLSSTDWITFNSKQPAGTYATGTGTATGTNTGDQDLSGLVPKSTTITINGITQDLSTNRSWTISGGGGGSLNYIAVTSNQSITTGNYYGVTCASNLTLTLADGTTSGQNLSIKKLDNTPYTITITGNIEYETSIIMDTQYESLDLFWNGTYYLIK